MTDSLGEAVSRRLEQWAADRVAERIWARDGSLWAASGRPADEVAEWLGWLDLPAMMGERIDEIRNLAAAVSRDGYRRAAVLGMGGSSLAPELCGRLFDGMTDLRVCDSTHPDAVRGFRAWATAARSIQFVSSKSGTTTETLAFHAAMAEVGSGPRLRGHHRPGHTADRPGPRPGVPCHRGGRAVGRRPLLGAVGVRAGTGRRPRRGRRVAARIRTPDVRRLPRAGRGQSRPAPGRHAGRGRPRRPRQADDPDHASAVDPR